MMNSLYMAAGALTGFVIGLTGVGGGALMTPILLSVFGVAPTTAIATDLWFAAVTKLVGARIHHQAGHIDWQIVKRLWAGSLPAAIITALAVSVGNRITALDWLTQGIGTVVLITALGLLFAPKLSSLARAKRPPPAKLMAWRPSITIVSGALLGVCVALTSIGAGALGSVLLLYLYPRRMTPHRLVATDLVHATPLAIVAGIGYLITGLVDWRMLVSMLAGSIPAIIAGSFMASKIRGRWVQIALSVVLMAAGIKTLV
jgi:uncharacterized protein